MSLTTLIIGVFAQLFFAGLQGLIVVFSGAAIANNSELTPFQDRLLATLMLLLPSISLATAGLLVVGYLSSAPWLSNLWHLVPVVGFGLYLLFVLCLNR
ncbi:MULTISPECIES: hypothetical protein [unclassified Pseudomonas]|uniref:hypothetical protein n=1 Tax=unclassified Pseudomonas TaxID=196821 RepID=UPI00096121CB|nr:MULTISPECIES: hypothetical protein [unclassified Pseudomonas]OLU13700.1 hypothetical protein BVH01_20340 [Pseudomonas sp. PA1(2017)]OLU27062.1 hypothetical protein BVH06_18810 [Pseudomonas sp. PA27(2017)]